MNSRYRPAGGVVASGGNGGDGGGSSPISIAQSSVKAAYAGGKLISSVGLSGTSASATTLSIAISKKGASKAIATGWLTIKGAGGRRRSSCPRACRRAATR